MTESKVSIVVGRLGWSHLQVVPRQRKAMDASTCSTHLYVLKLNQWWHVLRDGLRASASNLGHPRLLRLPAAVSQFSPIDVPGGKIAKSRNQGSLQILCESTFKGFAGLAARPQTRIVWTSRLSRLLDYALFASAAYTFERHLHPVFPSFSPEPA